MKVSGKLSVYWLHSHFLYWSGGTKYIFEVAKRLNKKLDLVVITEDASVLATKNYRNERIKLISLKKATSTSVLYWLTLPVQILCDYHKIDELIKKHERKGTKTILVSSMFPMNVVVYLLKRRHLQYCFEPFAFFHDPEFIKYFPLLKKILISITGIVLRPLDIWVTGKSNKIMTLNNTTAKYIRLVYGRIPTISYTGIDLKNFRPYFSNNLKDKYRNKKIIVHSTDYSPVKGTDRMLKIFKKVLDKVPDAHLLITSTISDYQAKTRLIKLTRRLKIGNNVDFLGFVDYKVLPQIYSIARALVQCSYSERSGTTSMALPVKEAMACGTLAIRYPIKNEDVIDGDTGFLVDPRDEIKMTEKIVEVLKMNNKKYNRASRKAQSFIKNKFTWENTTKIIEDEIKKLTRQ